MNARLTITCMFALTLVAASSHAADPAQTLADRLAPRLEGGWWDQVFTDWDRTVFVERHAADQTESEVDGVKIDGILGRYVTHEERHGRIRFVGRRVIDGEDGLLFRIDHLRTVDFLHLTLAEHEGALRWVDLRGLDSGRALSLSAHRKENLLNMMYTMGYMTSALQTGDLAALEAAVKARNPVAGSRWRRGGGVWKVHLLWPLAIQALSFSGSTDDMELLRSGLSEAHRSPAGIELLIAENLLLVDAWSSALVALERAEELIGEDSWIAAQRARCLRSLERPTEARAAAAQALAIDPASRLAWSVDLACLAGDAPFVPRLLEAEKATGLNAKKLLNADQFKRFKKTQAFKEYKKAR